MLVPIFPSSGCKGKGTEALVGAESFPGTTSWAEGSGPPPRAQGRPLCPCPLLQGCPLSPWGPAQLLAWHWRPSRGYHPPGPEPGWLSRCSWSSPPQGLASVALSAGHKRGSAGGAGGRGSEKAQSWQRLQPGWAQSPCWGTRSCRQVALGPAPALAWPRLAAQEAHSRHGQGLPSCCPPSSCPPGHPQAGQGPPSAAQLSWQCQRLLGLTWKGPTWA